MTSHERLVIHWPSRYSRLMASLWHPLPLERAKEKLNHSPVPPDKILLLLDRGLSTGFWDYKNELDALLALRHLSGAGNTKKLRLGITCITLAS